MGEVALQDVPLPIAGDMRGVGTWVLRAPKGARLGGYLAHKKKPPPRNLQ